MRETTPEVRLIAEPKVLWKPVEDYLASIDGLDWLRRVKPNGLNERGVASDAELLVEFAGRRCYRSWAPGLNANVTKVRADTRDYLTNILSNQHGAVLEHAQFTFDFGNVSRVFTHELVRHRAGVAISQESLRFVRLTDLGFRIPPILDRPDLFVSTTGSGPDDPAAPSVRDVVISVVERLEEVQRDLAEAFGLDDEGVPFHYKKEVTSALRRLAPIGLSTGMVWSANIRTLRHVIEKRTAPGAEEEIRIVFHEVGEAMNRACPLLFGDYTHRYVDDAGRELEIPWWVPAYEKV